MSSRVHLTNLLWSVADLLRGDYKQSEYGRVILPFAVLRRLDCVLEPTKAKVLSRAEKIRGRVDNVEPLLRQASGEQFYNVSPLTMTRMLDDPSNITDNLHEYLRAFSPGVADVLEKFDLHTQVDRLAWANLLYLVTSRFCEIDLHPDTVSNLEMGYLYEELVRRFSELSNETAGEHFTPRDVVRLMVNLLFIEDDALLAERGVIRTLADPACGTGGMLSVAQEHLRDLNPYAQIAVYGQELNGEAYAICHSNMMLEGQDATNIHHGNSFTEDSLRGMTFDYLITNPPFGMSWKNAERVVRDEAEQGFAGRFGAGLPRINDGSFIFLQHMISKMKPTAQGGSRVTIVFNGSPLSTGAAGSGESEIRRWIIENDWLEAVVALPDQLFYNTSISTYVWIVTNRKSPQRRGKVQLIDARDLWQKMRKSLGGKRKELSAERIGEIIRVYGEFKEGERVKILPNEAFGFLQITIEQPLRRRWAINGDTITALKASAAWATHMPPDADVDFTAVLGQRMDTERACRRAINRLNIPAPVAKELLKLAAIVDPEAPATTSSDGDPEPDPDLRSQEKITLPAGSSGPYELDVTARLSAVECRDLAEQYLSATVADHSPDAWVDHTRTRIGYAISPTLFFRPPLKAPYVPLREVAKSRPTRSRLTLGDGSLRHLHGQDLDSITSASDLPELPETDSKLMALCTDGDLVQHAGVWRVLPPKFGEAATALHVLRPKGPFSRALCEWLNSLDGHTGIGVAPSRVADDTPVPIDIITDDRLEELLKDVQENRRALHDAVSNLLPNLFAETTTETRRLLEQARSMATQATLITNVVDAAEDPVWRAERMFPFHVASLARQYMHSSKPAERKDALLKLGEGVARTVGILVLSESVDYGRLAANVGRDFNRGATFGTWVSLLDRHRKGTAPARMRELVDLRDNVELIDSLQAIKAVRNDASHAHGVRAAHQVDTEVDALESLVLSALSAANWLSAVQWDWVQRCEYIEEGSYLLVGKRLRGSHPHWEPFERPSTYPLRPDRLYAGTDTTADAGQPVGLSPLAEIHMCSECRSPELFLLNKVKGDDITLRSLEEHEADIRQPPDLSEVDKSE